LKIWRRQQNAVMREECSEDRDFCSFFSVSKFGKGPQMKEKKIYVRPDVTFTEKSSSSVRRRRRFRGYIPGDIKHHFLQSDKCGGSFSTAFSCTCISGMVMYRSTYVPSCFQLFPVNVHGQTSFKWCFS